MALSMGIRLLVSRQPAIQATRLLTLTLVGLSPTERASLHWTHIPDGRISRIRFEAAAEGLALFSPVRLPTSAEA